MLLLLQWNHEDGDFLNFEKISPDFAGVGGLGGREEFFALDAI